MGFSTTCLRENQINYSFFTVLKQMYHFRAFVNFLIPCDVNIDTSLHYSVSTSNTELHRLLLDCNETEQEIIIRTAKELKATLVSLGI